MNTTSSVAAGALMGSDALIGVLSSVVTEVLKYFPILNNNPLIKSLTAIVVGTVGAYLLGGGTKSLLSVLVWSFVSYQGLLQPMAKSINLKTQS